MIPAIPAKHALATLTILVVACAGCQSTRYRAETMPVDMRAASIEGGAKIHLPNLAAAASASAAISPGDVLNVRVLSGLEEKTPEPQVLQVSNRGDIDLPLIGRVVVSGLEPSAASQAVTAAAIERGVYRRPTATVEMRQRATHEVTVLGAVKEPGAHKLPVGACNVLAAIAAAGGMTEAAGSEVELMRQSNQTFLAQSDSEQAADNPIRQASHTAGFAGTARTPGGETLTERIDLAQATGSGAAPTQQLGDHDVVMVLPRKKRVIHVSGLVKGPDQFELPLDQDVRVLDAIAMAGGRTSQFADKVFVVRQRPEEQQPAVIEVSVSKAKQSGNENLILMAGDLVSVESTAATTTVGVIEKFFRVSLGLTSTAFAF